MNNLDLNTMFMFLSTMAQQFAPGGPAYQAASTAPASQPASVAPAAQPAAQLGAALTNTAPPPRATTYTSNRQPLASILPSARGHPNPATTNTNLPRLASGNRSRSADRLTRSEISEANNSRNQAIEAHFPPGPSLAPRRRRRGPAQPTPSLPPAETSIASVLETDHSSGHQHVHIETHVYYPLLSESLIAYLDDHNLRFVYRMGLDAKITDVIKQVTQDMALSPRKWSFREPSSSLRHHLRSHETLHLQLLGLSNRGIPRQRDGLIVLTRHPAISDLTIGDLLTRQHSQTFAKPRLCIRKGRLILNFGTPCDFSRPIGHHLQGSHWPKHLESSPFLPSYHDALALLSQNEVGEDTSHWVAPECDSDGESEEELEEVESALRWENSVLLSDHDSNNQNLPPTNCNAPVAAPSSAQVQVSSSPSQIPVHSQLWSGDWVPEPGRYRALFEATDFAKTLFETASSGRASTLAISGQDVHELAHALIAKIKAAAATNNFAPILAPKRNFSILKPDGLILSSGIGVEREVIYTSFRWFTDHQGAWLLPRFDDRCSIVTTMSLATSAYVSADRRENLVVFGCLTALMLIYGIAPDPLSPSLIHFAANKCELGSLTREFVGEWHPNLKTMLDTWDSIGPTGDITPFQSHFAIFHDIQIASLASRDLAQHQALGPDLLYTALIGSQPPSHSELQAFFLGLKLPCSNGFDFMQVLRSHPGGSATFLSHTWTSVIHDFDSLKPHLVIAPMSPLLIGEIAQPGSPALTMDLEDLLHRFLQGSGAPCPALLEEAIPRLSKLISFDQIDSPAFRSKALCWATTGSPHVEFDDQHHIVIHFVGPDNLGYDTSLAQLSYMKLGLISFRTCFRVARIPLVYLVDLCSRTYPARDHEGNDTEPFTLQQAIDHWLLVEILAGIGGHSRL
ncbi:hypothetical protein B0H14DRAFT_2564084 [Mycena olivaceomarginata]|nr:hypothetical protein B0H14DRAFT_2564084 [Mycena olivaceomarginata]